MKCDHEFTGLIDRFCCDHCGLSHAEIVQDDRLSV